MAKMFKTVVMYFISSPPETTWWLLHDLLLQLSLKSLNFQRNRKDFRGLFEYLSKFTCLFILARLRWMYLIIDAYDF